MVFIEWDNDYSVNVKELDEQHQYLIDIINKMYDMVAAENVDKSHLRRIFAELVDYTDYHFNREERLLKYYGYKDYEQHKKKHDLLAMQLLELQLEFSKGKTTITFDMLDFLNEWLINHILGTDKEYSSYLNSKGIY